MQQWINRDIKIDFALHKALRDMIDLMEKAEREEDYAYFNYFEAMDDNAKELYVRGELTRKQWDLLFNKYYGG